MEELILVGKSLTYAQQMTHCLERGGFFSRITRMPEKIRDTGCGYVVRIRKKDKAAALEQLRRCGYSPRRIYRMDGGDHYEEVRG